MAGKSKSKGKGKGKVGKNRNHDNSVPRLNDINEIELSVSSKETKAIVSTLYISVLLDAETMFSNNLARAVVDKLNRANKNNFVLHDGSEVELEEEDIWENAEDLSIKSITAINADNNTQKFFEVSFNVLLVSND